MNKLLVMAALAGLLSACMGTGGIEEAIGIDEKDNAIQRVCLSANSNYTFAMANAATDRLEFPAWFQVPPETMMNMSAEDLVKVLNTFQELAAEFECPGV